tara:strand:- start:66 stop:239 length:174 start_codon:yes stop_codon:yes gene_type:complete
MIDGVLIVALIIPAFICIVQLIIMKTEGTKGIEKEPYYGRKTGKMYTAEKSRETHLV